MRPKFADYLPQKNLVGCGGIYFVLIVRILMAFEIAHAVRPLVSIFSNGRWDFSGTGFIVRHSGRNLLVTANHVIENRTICIFKEPDDRSKFTVQEYFISAKLLVSNKIFDLKNFRTS